LEFIIVFIWLILLIFHVIYKQKKINIEYIIDPIFLFLIGQIIFLTLLGIVNHTGYLRSSKQFSFMSASYLLTLGLSFLIGSLILDKKRDKPGMLNKKMSKHRTRLIVKIAFFVSFIIGSLGTLILLRGFYYGDLFNLLPYFISNFNKFDKMFFNSSAAILWQANFAVLFFSAFLKDSWLKFIIISVAAINILFRAAFLYVVVAAFYFFIPNIILAKKKYSYIILFFVIILILMPMLNYQNSVSSIKKMLISVTPYTFGNFTNYNIYFSDMYTHNSSIYFDFVDIFKSLGFGSIMFYMDKYVGTDFLKYNTRPAPFFSQLQDYPRYGNLASFYSSFTKIPYLLAVLFCFFLGLLNRFVYNYAHKSLFFLSVYSWFAAANFMSFAGSGYFSATRFIPAVLFIWPFLFILSLFDMSISPQKARNVK